jgi:hypothetical protein
LLSQVYKVIDPVDEPAEHVAAEESMVTLLGSDRKFVVELVGEQPVVFAIVRHRKRLTVNTRHGVQKRRA